MILATPSETSIFSRAWIPKESGVGSHDSESRTMDPESGMITIERNSSSGNRREKQKNGSSCISDVDGRFLCSAPEGGGTQALSAGVDAGAAVSLQSGLRGMRQDSVSRPHFEDRSLAGRLLQSGRRMRSADGVDSRRRAADASGDRQDCRRAGGAQEIYLSLHQRAAAEREAAPVQAQQISELLGAR